MNEQNPKSTSRDKFQDIPVEQRAQALEDNAYRLEDQAIKKPFTSEQLNQFKDQLADETIKLKDAEAEFKKIKVIHNAEIKPIKSEINELAMNIRRRYEEHIGRVYLLANYTDGEMEYYDSEGHYLYSRPLMPTERQTVVHSMRQAN